MENYPRNIVLDIRYHLRRRDYRRSFRNTSTYHVRRSVLIIGSGKRNEKLYCGACFSKLNTNINTWSEVKLCQLSVQMSWRFQIPILAKRRIKCLTDNDQYAQKRLKNLCLSQLTYSFVFITKRKIPKTDTTERRSYMDSLRYNFWEKYNILKALLACIPLVNKGFDNSKISTSNDEYENVSPTFAETNFHLNWWISNIYLSIGKVKTTLFQRTRRKQSAKWSRIESKIIFNFAFYVPISYFMSIKYSIVEPI